MASGTDLLRNNDRDLALRWSSRWTLTHRILAVNIFALAILAGSLFYLDSFRTRLTTARLGEVATQARLIGDALAVSPQGEWQGLLRQIGQDSNSRLRVYAADGSRQLDSWTGIRPTYRLRDPALEPWHKDIALLLDNALDAIVGAKRPPLFAEPSVDRAQSWPEVIGAQRTGAATTALRRAPEGTAFVSAAAPIARSASVVLMTTNARDVRRVVPRGFDVSVRTLACVKMPPR